MSLRPVVLLLFVVALGLARGNNGAFAYPEILQDIAIDGKFDDWPAGGRWHPVSFAQYGSALLNAEDCRARFRIGYNDPSGCLLIAVEVSDDSVIGVIPEAGSWDTQDGCTLYLAPDHGPHGANRDAIAIKGGKVPDHGGAKGAVTRTGSVHRYEFSYHLGEATEPFTCALDVQIVDCDEDGSLTVIDWGRETFKMVSPDRVGDLIVPVGLPESGLVRIEYDSDRSIDQSGPILMRYESIADSNLVLDVLTGTDGDQTIRLPVGQYRRYAKSVGMDDAELIEVHSGETVDVVDLSVFGVRTGDLGMPDREVVLGSGIGSHLTRQFSPADGIPDGDIKGLATDSEGRLWIGAADLAFLDGERLHYFSEHPLLKDAGITTLHFDGKSNRLWIGTERGVRMIDPERWTVTEYESLSTTVVSSFLMEGDRLCVGTHHGLYTLSEGGEIRFHRPVRGPLPDRILSMALDPSTGHRWVGTDDGLFCFNGESYQRFGVDDGLDNVRIWALLFSDDGALWIGTGVSLFRWQSGVFEPIAASATGEHFRWTNGLIQRRNGEVIIGTQVGLNRVEENGKLVPLIGGNLFTVTEDNDGTLWSGSWNSLLRYETGLKMLDPAPASHTSVGGGNVLFYIVEDPERGWVLKRVGAAGWSECPLPEKPQCLFGESENEALVGTDSGVWRIGESGARLLEGSGWPRERCREIVKRGETCWILTENDLHEISPDRHRTYRIGDELPASVSSIEVDPNGRVAMSSMFGVGLIDNGRVTRITEADGLPDNMVTRVLFSQNGGLWVGTHSGLAYCNSGTTTTYSVDDGLTHKKVVELMENKGGELWAAGPYGLARFDGTVFQTMTGADGMAFRQIQGLELGASGQIWIRGDAGVYSYQASDSEPGIVVRDPDTDRAVDDVSKEWKLSTQENLAFHFEGVSLKTRRNGLVYRYRLAGFDDWENSRNRRKAYGQLPAGQYVFEVQAIDRDLNYSKVASLPVRVSHPWAQLIAGALIAVLLVLLGLLGWLYWRRNRLIKRTLETRVEERTKKLKEEIEEREKTQSQLRQSQKMEAVGTLAGGIAHDFNNLLTGVTGNLAVAKLDPEVAAEHISAAESAAHRASELVKQLLGFSRNTSMDLKVCQVNQIIDELRRLLRHGFDAGVEFEFDLASDLPPVRADSTQIEQVLLNLCVNARDALEGKGKIWISTRLVERREGDENHRIEVVVRDNGSGMPEGVKRKIFEPFFTTKDQGKGTGLGLAMSYGIIQQHGGEIDVESEPGEGTEFRVVLPAEARETVIKEEIPPSLSECRDLGGEETILVVDDESVVRTVAAGLLRRSGYGVEAVASGQEALDFLESRSDEIDAVLLDVTMPGLSGKEVLQQVNRLYPEMPVVICSGYLLDPEDLKKETGVRPADTVQKPYELRLLLRTLRKVLSKEDPVAMAG
ncbi:MAG: ATP-binding protein [Verrucomicrobiota bacterium]